MKLALASVLLVACSFPTPSEQYACHTTDDCDSNRVCTSGYCVLGAHGGDAPIDVDMAIDCTTFTSRLFDACMIAKPTGDLSLSTAGVYTYDTTVGTLLDPAGNATIPPNTLGANGRVLSVSSFHLAAGTTLRVTGGSPLIVASWDTISVAGSIDASSTATTSGAGSNPTGCAAHAAAIGQNDAGGGGGGGGGGQAAGGHGGVGSSGSGGGGLGGTAIAAPLLLGGCTGAKGGTGSTPPGDGGAGGGAIQLTARTSIAIAGTAKLHAGGAGGKPGLQDNTGGGGGGGGGGGMIGFEAPTLTVAAAAVLAANGGGGGQGAGNVGGAPGQNALISATRALGGNTGSGGVGGVGGGGITLLGGGGGNDGAGGGGGGAAGFVVYKSAAATIDPGAIVSPTAIVVP